MTEGRHLATRLRRPQADELGIKNLPVVGSSSMGICVLETCALNSKFLRSYSPSLTVARHHSIRANHLSLRFWQLYGLRVRLRCDLLLDLGSCGVYVEDYALHRQRVFGTDQQDSVCLLRANQGLLAMPQVALLSSFLSYGLASKSPLGLLP